MERECLMQKGWRAPEGCNRNEPSMQERAARMAIEELGRGQEGRSGLEMSREIPPGHGKKFHSKKLLEDF